MYSILNPRTFPSAIACFIIYWWRGFPKRVSVMYCISPSFLAFSLKIGVPVKPKYWAFLKKPFTSLCIFPNWLRWHSSIRNTTFSFAYSSIIDLYFGSFMAWDIFWIVVIMSFRFLSFVCSVRAFVSSVRSTLFFSYSLKSSAVCVSRSRRSMRKNTFLISGCVIRSFAHFQQVKVFPAPVVCQI